MWDYIIDSRVLLKSDYAKLHSCMRERRHRCIILFSLRRLTELRRKLIDGENLIRSCVIVKKLMVLRRAERRRNLIAPTASSIIYFLFESQLFLSYCQNHSAIMRFSAMGKVLWMDTDYTNKYIITMLIHNRLLYHWYLSYFFFYRIILCISIIYN